MKNYFFLILIVCLSLTSTNIFGQSEIDSLKTIFKTAKTSVEKLDAAIELSDKLDSEQNQETIKYLKIAQGMLRKHPDSLRQARLNRNFGYYLIYTGEYIKASEYFLNGIEIAEKIGDIELKNNIINNQKMQGANYGLSRL